MFLNCILDAVVLAVSVFVFVSVRAKNSKTAVYKLMIHVTRYRKMWLWCSLQVLTFRQRLSLALKAIFVLAFFGIKRTMYVFTFF